LAKSGPTRSRCVAGSCWRRLVGGRGRAGPHSAFRCRPSLASSVRSVAGNDMRSRRCLGNGVAFVFRAKGAGKRAIPRAMGISDLGLWGFLSAPLARAETVRLPRPQKCGPTSLPETASYAREWKRPRAGAWSPTAPDGAWAGRRVAGRPERRRNARSRQHANANTVRRFRAPDIRSRSLAFAFPWRSNAPQNERICFSGDIGPTDYLRSLSIDV
jgi:hypothetical protein